MNTALICNLCKKHCNTNITTFTCNHSICSLCLNRLLIMNELSGLDNLREVKIKCNCLHGEYKFPLSELTNVLTSGVVYQHESPCNAHNDITAKHYCCICSKWLCAQCYNQHKDLYPEHPTSSYKIDEEIKCFKHQDNNTSHYCKQCKEELCFKCIEENNNSNSDVSNSKHKGHLIYTFYDYFTKKKRRTFRNGYSTYYSFEKKIEEICNKYLQFYDIEVKEKEDLIKSSIEQLTRLASYYKEEMALNKDCLFSMLESLKHAYKVFYSSINSSNQTVQYYKLSKGYKKDFNDIVFITDHDEELKTIQEMKAKYTSRSHLKYEFVFSHFAFDSVTVLKGHKQAVLSLAAIKQDNLLASASQDHYIRLWDLNTYECLNILEGHSDAVFTLYGYNDVLLSGSRDDRLINWDLNTMKVKDFANGHSIHVYSIIKLSNGNLASGSRDESIKLWDFQQDKAKNKITLIKTLKGHENTVLSLIELLPGQLASGAADSMIKIWDIAKSKCIFTITKHTDSVNCLAKLSDGNFASCSSDKSIKIFNRIDYSDICILNGHTESVYALIQLKDSRLASGSCDFTIMLWDINDKTCTQILKGHKNTVFFLLQLKDGRLISSSGDDTIRVWN